MRRMNRKLGILKLEQRENPAVFNISAGDVAALVAAVDASNKNAEPDTINLATGSTYLFTAAANTQAALGLIAPDDVTINGNGAKLERSADVGTPSFRFITIGVFPNLPRVTVNDLAFVNGNADTNPGGAILLNSGDLLATNCTFTGNQGTIGGAIYATNATVVQRTLTLTNCNFTNNSSTNGAGGAVYQLGSTNIGVTNCLFQMNTSSAEGGALRYQTSNSTITITTSTFAENTAKGGNGGGGVFIQGPATITDCTVRDNTSAIGGGGIWIQNGGSLVMRGSTVSGNKANSSVASGGGLFSQGPTTIENCTIHNNRAGSGGGINFSLGPSTIATITHTTITGNQAFFALAAGAGVNITGSGTCNIGHTIVAENSFDTGVSGKGPDISGTVNSLDYNLIGNTSGATINGSTMGNLTGISPNLGPLQNNGGLTFTRRPNVGSPVRNAGDPAFVGPPNTDQRGAGFARVVGGRIDVGAVEAVPAQVISVQINDGTPQRSKVTYLVVTFNQPVVFTPSPAAAFELVRQGDNAPVNMNANAVANSVTITFTSGAVEFGSLADGRYTLTILAANVDGGDFDGNGDGVTGDNYELASQKAASPPNPYVPPTNIFRLFGDGNGDGAVTSADFALFRQTFGAALNLAFDFGGDGNVTADDFAEFRKRFGLMI